MYEPFTPPDEPRTIICSDCHEPLIYDELNDVWIHESTEMEECPYDESIEI
jgi:hypothetical protein